MTYLGQFHVTRYQILRFCEKKLGFLETAPKKYEEVSGSLWKHHQSKARTFLNRSCTVIFFPTPQKHIIFRDRKMFREIFEKFSKNEKSQTFSMKNHMIFRWKGLLFLFFQKISFFIYFFRSIKKYLFSELKKMLGHSFDVKKLYLSIYDVFIAFWAL